MSFDEQGVGVTGFYRAQENRTTSLVEEAQSTHKRSSKSKGSSLKLRRMLLAAVVGGAMIAVPQVARATVVDNGGGNYELQDAGNTATQTVTHDDATVTTTSDFSVNTTTGGAVSITGDGSISYDDGGDNNDLTTTSSSDDGLNIGSAGDIAGGNDGSVIVVSGGTITSNDDGIYAYNNEAGDISITTSGDVTGDADGGGIGGGIYLVNSGADSTIISTGQVSGATGIYANNNGTGSTEITNTRTVTGTTDDGIHAYNNILSTDLTIEANNVSGADYGIYARNDGTGATEITSTGTVTGTTIDGILAVNNGTDLTINANNVEGADYGINATNNGTRITSVTNSGTVQGGTAGVRLQTASTTNPATLIINSGSLVQNSSNDSADLAIQIVGATGGTAAVANSGDVLGTVDLGDEDDTFTNDGSWSFTDDSTFGAGNNTLHNNGLILATNSSGIYNTTISGVDHVIDSGDIVLQNGIAGDVLTITNGGTRIYETAGSNSFYSDVDLNTGLADKLHVDNVVTGSVGPNGVRPNVVNGLGQPTTGDGIKIINVDGTSDDDAFILSSGAFTGGLYSYDLGQGNVDTQSWFLQSAVRAEAAAAGVLPVLGSRTALSTLSNLHDRQRDVEVFSDNANSRKGVWGRVFGQSNDFRTNDTNDFGFNSKVWGVQAGLDLKASDDGNGNRKYAGLYIA